MPFTFSHPAIVLPFLKIRHASISMSALIIGSITPDFEYFIRMKATGRYSHTLEGMFFLDLPVACIIAVVFHLLVKQPLLNNAPNYFYSRLIVLKNFDFITHIRNNFLSFIGCLLIGIASHILWDSFTHSNEYFVDKISFLSSVVSVAGLFKAPLYLCLQHASSAIGIGFLALYFHRQPVQKQKNDPSIKFWIVWLMVACIVFAVRASLTFEYFADIAATSMSAGIIGLITSSILSRIFSPGRNQ